MKNETMKQTMTQEDMEYSLQAALKEFFVGKVEKAEKGVTLLLNNGQKFSFEVRSL